MGAGAAAWGLRDADRWRWNRPVLTPFVALGIVAILPTGALLVTMHGPLFPIEILTRMNVPDLSWLAQLVVIAGLLAWSARLPRRTAAVVLLVLLVPRFASSVAMLSSGNSGVTTEPFTALGLVAEAALIAMACWWLSRDDDLTALSRTRASGGCALAGDAITTSGAHTRDDSIRVANTAGTHRCATRSSRYPLGTEARPASTLVVPW